MKCIQFIVTGQVQGVFFRQSTAERAADLGVRGWVRNLPDGRVQGLAVGPADAVDRLVEFCRRGPPAARVTGIKVEDATADETLAAKFEIRR